MQEKGWRSIWIIKAKNRIIKCTKRLRSKEFGTNWNRKSIMAKFLSLRMNVPVRSNVQVPKYKTATFLCVRIAIAGKWLWNVTHINVYFFLSTCLSIIYVDEMSDLNLYEKLRSRTAWHDRLDAGQLDTIILTLGMSLRGDILTPRKINLTWWGVLWKFGIFIT